MRKSFLFALAFLSASMLSAQPYVWASFGLVLCKTPDFKGEKIAMLPYGTPVEILGYADTVKGHSELSGEDFEEPARVSIKVMDISPNVTPYPMWGAWVKAKALGMEGFVFDGFLSDMPPNTSVIEKKGELPSVPEGMKALYGYYSKKCGVLRETEQEIIFGDGTYLELTQNKFEDTKWIFPHLNEHDGYLLFDYFLNFEKKSLAKNDEWFKFSSFDEVQKSLGFFYQGYSNMVLSIKFYEGMTIVVSQWGGE